MNKIKLISWVAVILWMLLIFLFSHQPASTSSELSGGITEQIIAVLQKILPDMGIAKEELHTFVRKNAHFFVYLILGMLTFNAVRKNGASGFRSGAAAFCICVLYAISDETHQLFIPGRSGEARDVLIDSAGAGIGIGAFFLVSRILPRKKHRDING